MNWRTAFLAPIPLFWVLATLSPIATSGQTCSLDVFVTNDQSGSVSALENTQSRQFISALFNGMQPWGNGAGESRMAIADWDNPGVWLQFNYPSVGQNYTTLLSDVLAYQNAPRALLGGTDPYTALLSTFQQLAQTPVPGRTSKPIIVLMTDAACSQVPAGLSTLASQIKNSGVFIIVVAIEAASTCPSLAGTNVASPGGYFSAPTYAGLIQANVQLVQDIINTACLGSVDPSYDLAIALDNYTATGCNTGSPVYTVDYTVNNGMGAAFNDQLVISFYDGDPTLATTNLLAVQNAGVQSIPINGSYSGTFSSLQFANSADLIAVVNFNGAAAGNAPPISPYLSTGTAAPDEYVTYNNVSNTIARVSDPVTCPPHAVITANITTGGAGCDDLVTYSVSFCNTGDAPAFVTSTLPITPPGAVLVNNVNQVPTYTNGLVWATYDGGSDADEGYSVAIDPSGNVYLAGTTQSTTNIATAGAHDVTHGGGTDAFLVKFDTDGNRLWGTYYGGIENDHGSDVAVDNSGNVYLVGYTESLTSIATAGAYQTAHNSSDDAFIVKFNSAGVRQWGTYYGGTEVDFGESVATDAAGNVYLSGMTQGSTNLASAGSHQTAFDDISDLYLVKFSATGARLWATYYGGAGEDLESNVATDPAGSVYLAGQTQSANAISTAGSHQPGYNGDDDVFLVKFNPAGIRQWGTYYGGLQQDLDPSVTTDPSGNVYLGGTTKSPTAIASGALHQSVFGGIDDAFLTKFNTSGVRQWGTYHGGVDSDLGGDVSTDNAGNVYMNGTTLSPTVMSTPGAYQTAIAGLNDAFVAKFSPLGEYGWGTYYGGPAPEDAWGVGVDAQGSVYICGTTASNTGIATAGAHQAAFGNLTDAYLAKFNEHEIGSILYEGECISRQFIYDYSGVAPGPYDLSVGVIADTVNLGDGPAVVLPDLNFNAGTYTGIDGFNGALHSTDDVTIVAGGVNCPPGDRIVIAVDLPATSSCGDGNYVQANVTITNTSGTVVHNTELHLNLTGGATFAGELYAISAGLNIAQPNLLDPNYPFVPYALFFGTGDQYLPILDIPAGVSTFSLDLNIGFALTNLIAQIDSIHSALNLSGSAGPAFDATGVAVLPFPSVSGFSCPGSINAGNNITLTGISVTNATSALWSSSTLASVTNAGTVSAPSIVYVPTPMDVANGFVEISLTATSAGGCETTESCQVQILNVQYDYGDAPISYDLNINYQPPAAASTLFPGLYMGSTGPGTEMLANNSFLADGDGLEEDGLTSNPYTVPWPSAGSGFTLPVISTNSSSSLGFLHGYIDWNADGDFLDSLESSLNTISIAPLSGTQSYDLLYTVPPFVNTSGLFYIRLRLSVDSLAVTIPYMAAPRGETEDYVWSSVGPLPVEMVSFTGKDLGHAVQLDWMTASEWNSAYFTIERSTDLQQFEALGSLPAAGYSMSEITYSFVDQEPLPGISYYRLEQVDSDGATEFFGPISMQRGLGTDLWLERISTNEILIHLPDLNARKVAILDMMGRSHAVHWAGNGRFEISGLANGLYLVSITSPNGVTENRKFLVD